MNPPFPQPILQPVTGSDTNMQVVETYTVFLPSLNKTLTVLPGFQTDGASIPQIFWTCAGNPFSPDYVAAAVCHDALYCAELCTRDQADNEFLKLMGEEGMSWFHRHLFYWAVRIGGGIVWNRHTAVSIADARKYCTLTQPDNAP